MGAIDEIVEEKKEESNMYLDGSLKILGMGQIAAGIADIFWGGSPNLNIFNVLIIITGVIFFFGAEKLMGKWKDIMDDIEKKRQENYKYKSENNYELSYVKTVDEYKKKKEREDFKNYEDLAK
ncbi:MAG: hypothetical protein ACQER9_03210 [Nanobdellota archaeon]